MSTRLGETNPYPYSLSKAKKLLTSTAGRWCRRHRHVHGSGHGADQCGAGIPAGAPLNFNLQFATGIDLDHRADDDREVVVGPGGHPRHADLGLVRHRLGNAVPCTRAELHLGAPGLGRQLGSTPPTTTRPVRRSSPPGRSQLRELHRTRPTTPTSWRPTSPTSTSTTTRTHGQGLPVI